MVKNDQTIGVGRPTARRCGACNNALLTRHLGLITRAEQGQGAVVCGASGKCKTFTA
jgi:hypothetical protein